MRDDWTDFEKWVFEKLEKIDGRLNRLEIRAAVFGVIGAALLRILWPR